MECRQKVVKVCAVAPEVGDVESPYVVDAKLRTATSRAVRLLPADQKSTMNHGADGGIAAADVNVSSSRRQFPFE